MASQRPEDDAYRERLLERSAGQAQAVRGAVRPAGRLTATRSVCSERHAAADAAKAETQVSPKTRGSRPRDPEDG